MNVVVIYVNKSDKSTESAKHTQRIFKEKLDIDVTLFNGVNVDSVWQTFIDSNFNILDWTHFGAGHVDSEIATFFSHYNLWWNCVMLNEPILILEHDAIFTRQFKPFKFEGGAISINNPDHATFNWKLYDKLDNSGEQEVPWVADKNIPQGLPGHSAYIIKPDAAEKICSLQDTIGWWPNDAIMCKQLCTWLRAYKPYFTKVQGIKSTTSK